MKKQLMTAMMMITALSVFSIANPVFAQAGNGQWGNGPGEFIDENGDGFNDLAPDADGDGIPNAYDEDYVAPHDGSGAGSAGNGGHGNGSGDGTGSGGGNGNGNGGGRNGNGPGDGTGVGPGDGVCLPELDLPKPGFKVRQTR